MYSKRNVVRVELQIDVEIGAIRRLGKFQIMTGASRPRNDANLRQAARTFLQNQMIAKQFEIADINVIPVRD